MSIDVVVFGAHPDDAEMGMAGTIARLTDAGHRVCIISLSAGESGTFGDRDTRAQEAQAAAAILGCETRLLDFPDTRIVCDVPARERIMDLLRELQPRIVFAPFPYSRMGHRDGAAHLDHVATGEIARQAVRLARLRGKTSEFAAHDVRRLYYYMVPRNTQPSLFVDVTQTYDKAIAAISAYASQMRIHKQGTAILEILRGYRTWYGMAAGCPYAEAFLCEEPLQPEAEALLDL
jgi:bacillithiol biosynthesis deacetylase BshB1